VVSLIQSVRTSKAMRHKTNQSSSLSSSLCSADMYDFIFLAGVLPPRTRNGFVSVAHSALRGAAETPKRVHASERPVRVPAMDNVGPDRARVIYRVRKARRARHAACRPHELCERGPQASRSGQTWVEEAFRGVRARCGAGRRERRKGKAWRGCRPFSTGNQVGRRPLSRGLRRASSRQWATSRSGESLRRAGAGEERCDGWAWYACTAADRCGWRIDRRSRAVSVSLLGR
jgi:hypothetical protein